MKILYSLLLVLFALGSPQVSFASLVPVEQVTPIEKQKVSKKKNKKAKGIKDNEKRAAMMAVALTLAVLGLIMSIVGLALTLSGNIWGAAIASIGLVVVLVGLLIAVLAPKKVTEGSLKDAK